MSEIRGHVYTRLPSRLTLAPAVLSPYASINFSSFSFECRDHCVKVTEGWAPHRSISLSPAQWLDVAPFFRRHADRTSDEQTLTDSEHFYRQDPDHQSKDSKHHKAAAPNPDEKEQTATSSLASTIPDYKPTSSVELPTSTPLTTAMESPLAPAMQSSPAVPQPTSGTFCILM